MIGRYVQNVKDDMSSDFLQPRWHYRPMSSWSREQEFNEAYIARIKRLREDRGWTSEQMAIALGVPADRYRKYEYRTPLPQYLIEPFAHIVDRDVAYILTGRTADRGSMRAVRTGTND